MTYTVRLTRRQIGSLTSCLPGGQCASKPARSIFLRQCVAGALNGADDGLMVVRLADIDYSIRYEVASKIIERGKLVAVEAQELLMAAV